MLRLNERRSAAIALAGIADRAANRLDNTSGWQSGGFRRLCQPKAMVCVTFAKLSGADLEFCQRVAWEPSPDYVSRCRLDRLFDDIRSGIYAEAGAA